MGLKEMSSFSEGETLDFHKLREGSLVYQNVKDFDTPKPYSIAVTITKITEDAAYGMANDVKVYIDDDTAHLFSMSPQYPVRKV